MGAALPIAMEGVSKRFAGRTVLDDVTLQVSAGEVMGFLGPNGAGKTTAIGIVLGLVRADAGRVLVFGHDVARAPVAALASVGAMLEPVWYPYLSARDNLRVLARARGVDERRIDTVLALVGLTPNAHARLAGYSRGMRQRVGVAGALLAEPRLVVLDEPTEGLDPAGRHEVHELVRRLAGEGRTVFFSSHVLDEVERVCDRVAILAAGRLVACGRVGDLVRGSDGLLVRVAGDPASAAAVLRAADGETAVACEGDALVVDTSAARAAELNALLVARGVRVTEMRARERRLEDLFLELTGDHHAPLERA